MACRMAVSLGCDASRVHRRCNPLPGAYYRPIVGIVLLIGAARLLWPKELATNLEPRDPPVWFGVRSAVLPLDSYPVSPEQAAESFYRRFCYFSDGLPQNRLQCGANRTGAKSIDSNSEEARRREHRRHDSHPVVERGDRCISAGPFRAWRPNPELRENPPCRQQRTPR
jgi:hypothetical protein